MIGWIADIRSNGRRGKRHVQDNLFWPVPARFPAWRRRLQPPSQLRQSAGRPLPLRPKGCGGGKSGLHRHTVPD